MQLYLAMIYWGPVYCIERTFLEEYDLQTMDHPE